MVKPIDIKLNDRISPGINRKLAKMIERARGAHVEISKLSGSLKGSSFSGNASQLAAYNRELARMARLQSRVTRNQRASLTVMNRQSRSAASLGSSIRAIGSAYLAFEGGRFLVGAGETFTNLENKIRNVSTSSEDLQHNMDRIFQIANDARVPVDDLGKAYQRFDLAIKANNGTSAETARITSTVSKLLTLQGAAASESGSALLQLSQAFNKGKLDGDEFRSVMELMPRLADSMARTLGITRGELLNVARTGAISVDVMRESILNLESEVDQAFGNTTVTIGQALTQMKNDAIQFVGETGFTGIMAKGISQTRDGFIAMGEILDDFRRDYGWVFETQGSGVGVFNQQASSSRFDEINKQLQKQRSDASRVNSFLGESGGGDSTVSSSLRANLRAIAEEHTDVLHIMTQQGRSQEDINRLFDAYAKKVKQAKEDAARGLFGPDTFKLDDQIQAQRDKITGIKGTLAGASDLGLPRDTISQGLANEEQKLHQLEQLRQRRIDQMNREASASGTSAAQVVQGLEFENRALQLNTQARERILRLRQIVLQIEGGSPEDIRRIDDLLRENQGLTEQARLMQQIKGPQEQFNIDKQALQGLLERGKISIDEYNQKLREMQDALNGTKGSAPGAGAGAFQGVNSALQQNRDFYGGARNDALDYFQTVQSGAKQSSQAFGNFTTQAQGQVGSLFNSVGQGFQSLGQGGGGGGGQGGGLLGFVFNVVGGLFQAFGAQRARAYSGYGSAALAGSLPSSVPRYAAGGFVPGRQLALVGEAGPEFVANARATARNRSALEQMNRSGSLPSSSVNVRVENYGSDRVRVERGPTPDEVRVIVAEEVNRRTPRLMSDEFSNANSRSSQSLRANTNTRRRR